MPFCMACKVALERPKRPVQTCPCTRTLPDPTATTQWTVLLQWIVNLGMVEWIRTLAQPEWIEILGHAKQMTCQFTLEWTASLGQLGPTVLLSMTLAIEEMLAHTIGVNRGPLTVRLRGIEVFHHLVSLLLLRFRPKQRHPQ